METINLYDAIAEMRQITKEGGSFSMVFISFDKTRQRSDGVIEVSEARLRSSAPAREILNSEHKINYLDIELNEPRQFWQPLLMFFNGLKVVLK